MNVTAVRTIAVVVGVVAALVSLPLVVKIVLIGAAVYGYVKAENLAR